MKLLTIAEGTSSEDAELLSNAERDFAKACELIESGAWDDAYTLFARLSQMPLPADLLYAARTARDIVDPKNSTEQKAGRILELLPGNLIHLYDDEEGWSDTGLREIQAMRHGSSNSVS